MKIEINVTDEVVKINGRKNSFLELGLYENLGNFFVPMSCDRIMKIIQSNFNHACLKGCE